MVSTYSVRMHKQSPPKLILSLDDSMLQEIVYQLSKTPSTPIHADVIVNAESNSTLNIGDICAFTTAVELICNVLPD